MSPFFCSSCSLASPLQGDGRTIGKMNIVTMTDRSGEQLEIEGDMACGPETGLDLHGEDQPGTELGHFLDHLDDFERLQIIRWDDDRLVVEDDGLPYARLVAAQFDRYRGAILRDNIEHMAST